MHRATTENVLKALKNVFGENDQVALAELKNYGPEDWHKECNRVYLAIIKLSEGDLDKLKHFVVRAAADYRDVLLWAEYEVSHDGKQLPIQMPYKDLLKG